MNKFNVLLLVLAVYACGKLTKESEGLGDDQVSIIDTLKYGDYYRDQKKKDNIYLRIYDAKADTIISHLVDGKEYQVRFEVPRLNYLEVIPQIMNNGKLEKIDSIYILNVRRADESNYMQIDFSLDLKGDSILIQNRDWSDSTKTSYEENFVGFKPKGTFRISIKRSEENFDDFLSRFNTDTAFQLERISFPFEATIIDPHEGGEAGLIYDNAEQWKHLNLEYTGSTTRLEFLYEQDTIRTSNQVTITQKGGNEKITLDESFTFLFRDNKWMLVTMKDLSY